MLEIRHSVVRPTDYVQKHRLLLLKYLETWFLENMLIKRSQIIRLYSYHTIQRSQNCPH